MTTGKLVYVLAPPGKYLKLPVTNLRWRPGNSSQRTKNVLVATYAEGITRHWHVTQSKCMDTIAEGENNLYALDYNPDATRFATGGKDYRIRVYDESTKQLCSTMTGGHNESTVGHANRIFSLKYHPRGDNMILSGGWDDTLQIWDVRVGQAVRSIYGPHICGDAIDMEGNEILTGSWRLENQIQLWDYGTGKLIKEIPWSKSDVDECLLYAAMFSNNDNGDMIFAAGSGTNEARIYDKKTSMHLGTVSGISKSIYAMDLDPGNKLLAVAGGDGYVRIASLEWCDSWDD
eukprot:TRINITY_DN12561_c0_g1_i1.p1 TRINITY_DN12561_c0_g1~~TRINITY_DN12561_c0_g1_i1.p1  ORF type:complete len:289 (-),score=47.45 TRINITY_DN12561_c0_g1_i1:326-1192(-)